MIYSHIEFITNFIIFLNLKKKVLITCLHTYEKLSEKNKEKVFSFENLNVNHIHKENDIKTRKYSIMLVAF